MNDHYVYRAIVEITEQVGFSRPPLSIARVLKLYPLRLVRNGVIEGSHAAKIEAFAKRASDGARGRIVCVRGMDRAAERFAIAHSLAHWIFDFDRGARPHARAFKRLHEERRADFFAAELLMPVWHLERRCTRLAIDPATARPADVVALARAYAVPVERMRHQLAALGMWRRVRW